MIAGSPKSRLSSGPCSLTAVSGNLGESLMLTQLSGFWIASEGEWDGDEFNVRQMAFRMQEDPRQAGWHKWEINLGRSKKNSSTTDPRLPPRPPYAAPELPAMQLPPVPAGLRALG